jgi:UDP-glucuronate decarboxylase
MIDKIISEDIQKINAAIDSSAFAKKKALVTGGAGFIGSWLCDVLLACLCPSA